MSPEALIEAAGLALQQRQLPQAESLIREALTQDPSSFKATIQLSLVLRLQGDLAQAQAIAERAVELRPHSMEGHLQLALCLMGQSLFNEAIQSFLGAAQIKPNLAPLHHNIGLCYENLGRQDEAIAAFRRAMTLSPEDLRSRISLGGLFLADEQIEPARQCAESAIKLVPESSDAHLLMARVLAALKRDDASESSMRKAVEFNPQSSAAQNLLGLRLLQKGAFHDSETCFRTSLDIDPAQGIGYFGITQGRKITEVDRPLVEQMESASRDGWISNDESGYLHFGLAKAFDNLGEFEKAMEHYHRAHHFSHHVKNPVSFDHQAYSEQIDRLIQTYQPHVYTDRDSQQDSHLPIFILGMMRSGTTLTEQILSSHPMVGAAGEHWFWPKRKDLAENRHDSTVDPKLASSLAREYCRELRLAAPGFPRVTDKMPGNYLQLGLIHLALPNAKIIHTRRNPVDTSLSIYFTPNSSAPEFAHTPEDIVFAYREYERLMDHWRSILPQENLLEIVYEELVEDPQPVIRKMIEFCGLPWNDACLHHETNSKVVKTPSLWQVRQPMYKTSAGRSKRYQPWLGAFADLEDLTARSD